MFSSHADQDLGVSFNNGTNLLCSNRESPEIVGEQKFLGKDHVVPPASQNESTKAPKCLPKTSLNFTMTESPSMSKATTLSVKKVK